MNKKTTETQLAAAETTITVLKNKVKQLYSGEAASIIQKQLIIAKEKAEKRQFEQNLAMQEILDHVVFGFFTIDRSHTVLKGCSQSVFHLFAKDKVIGRDLGENLGLPANAADYLKLCIDEVFEDLLPESVTLAQIPSKFFLGDKVLRLEGRTIRGADAKVDKILFTLTDVSELEQAQKAAQQNEMLVTILKAKAAFQEFLVETKRGFAETLQLEQAEDQPTIRRFVHTIKGNYASFGMLELVEEVHDAEANAELHRFHIAGLETSLKQFLDNNWNILEITYEEVDSAQLAISDSQLGSLRAIISDLPEEKQNLLRAWTEKIAQKPAGAVLGPIDEFAVKLAHRLGKDIDLTINGRTELVDVELLRPVFQNLTHLLRNAIDHGIEEFDRRQSLGKPRNGQITISIASQPNQYQIVLTDDGRGIDTDFLVRKAVAAKLVSKKQAESLAEKARLELVFLDGLSTADLTTEVSGRGIGMAAVRSIITSLGGQLTIDSQLDVGATFTITIPRIAAAANNKDGLKAV